MKKYFWMMTLALATGLFAGCEKNEPCAFHKMTVDIPVEQNEWKFDADKYQFYVHVPVSSLTADVYNYGEVSISREENGDLGVYQTALPMSIFHEEEVEYDDHSIGYLHYTQLIDYRYGVGYVEIQVTNSDFSYYKDAYGRWINPEGMLFRMQMTY